MYGAEMLRVEWAADQQSPLIEVTAQVQTQDRSVVPGQGSAPPLSDAERKLNLAATDLLPTDGLVKETAEEHRQGQDRATSPRRARSTTGWSRTPSAIPRRWAAASATSLTMIKTGNLNGKCADLNALYVGLARSVGLPARDVYGIRVVPSQFGFKALGAGSENVTKAQHCRAEVWLPGSGWTPVDPADVRKVVLEEPPGNLAMTDPKVVAARKALFGAWEGNWVAFNDAHDVKLPGSNEAGHRLPDVSAGREQGRLPRFARPGQVQVPHHGARTDRLTDSTPGGRRDRGVSLRPDPLYIRAGMTAIDPTRQPPRGVRRAIIRRYYPRRWRCRS